MSENRMKAFVGHYLTKLKTFFFSKNVLSFLVFLVLSFLFWFINTLDKERQVTLTIPVRYNQLPHEMDITNANSSVVQVTVKDKGLNLLNYSEATLSPITIDLNRNFYSRGKIVVTNSELKAKLSVALLSSTSILSVKPDSLLLVYERLSAKKLPVQLEGKIDLAQQYVLSDKITIVPDSILVYGSARDLARLNTVNTEPLQLKELDEDVEKTLHLQRIPRIRFSVNDVKVNIHTEMFTEKELVFPVRVLNCPPDLTIRTFPSQIKLKFNVGLSHFKTVSVDDVTIEIDYQKILKNNTGKQKINIKNNVSYISNIRPEITDIEYIIERK
ncbi:MAG: CdaR family protein [Paludibacter sp.]